MTATKNNTPVRPFFVLPYASAPCYVLAPCAKAADLHDRLNAKLLHLAAMLNTTYGECGEAFRNRNHTTQDNFMWGCSEIADECLLLLQQTDAKYDATAGMAAKGAGHE